MKATYGIVMAAVLSVSAGSALAQAIITGSRPPAGQSGGQIAATAGIGGPGIPFLDGLSDQNIQPVFGDALLSGSAAFTYPQTVSEGFTDTGEPTATIANASASSNPTSTSVGPYVFAMSTSLEAGTSVSGESGRLSPGANCNISIDAGFTVNQRTPFTLSTINGDGETFSSAAGAPDVFSFNLNTPNSTYSSFLDPGYTYL